MRGLCCADCVVPIVERAQHTLDRDNQHEAVGLLRLRALRERSPDH